MLTKTVTYQIYKQKMKSEKKMPKVNKFLLEMGINYTDSFVCTTRLY